jgi:putative flippase GtrA
MMSSFTASRVDESIAHPLVAADAVPSGAVNIFSWLEFFRYFSVSVLALMVDAGGLFLLVENFHWHYLPSAMLCFLTGSFVAFALSSAWAFKKHSFKRWHDGFVLFSVIGLLGLLVNMAVLWVGVSGLGLPYMAAKAGAAVASFSLNFVLRKFILFTEKHDE